MLAIKLIWVLSCKLKTACVWQGVKTKGGMN